MRRVFIGSEMLKRGELTRGSLRWNYQAIFPDVYAPKTALRLRDNTVGAWLWSGRNGVIAGQAAAALHGALWIPDDTPVEMIWRSGRPPTGIVVRDERIDADEIVELAGLPVTTPERTAWDLARHLDRDLAVSNLDSLARATDVKGLDALLLGDRYPRARGLRRCEIALDLMDGGAQSPQETRIRLILIDDGLPRPRTQIRVTDGFNEAFLDMGYDEPMVGIDYDGRHHATDRPRYVHDIGRNELVTRLGWHDIHVVAEHTNAFVLHRVREALRLRRGS